MAKFVLTAELAVRNQNLRPVITQLQKQLNSVKANVTLKLDASTKGKLDNINKALAITDQRLKSAAGAAVVLNQQISQLNKTLGGNLKQLNQVTKTAQANAKAMTATSKAANQTASGMTRLGQQSAFAIKRIAAFSVATSAVIALTTAMKSGIQEAILFQHGLVRVSQITGTSIKNLGGLTAEITRLSTTLGVSSQELLNVSDTLAQAGLSANEVTVALEALAKTKLAPTFGKIEDTVEGVIASMRQFKIEAKDLEATLGSFNSVAAAFAVESQDIVTAVRRSGAAFQAAGGSLEEFIALFTSVRQTTRESAETIATGFRTIFTRIQRPKTLGFLRDLGVELLDLKGQFVGPYEAVRRLSDALAAIPGNDPRFAQIIEELGGFRQVSKVIPLIQQFAVAEKALAVAQRGRGSLTRDAVTAQQSLLVQLTNLRERFFELFRTIGDNTAIQGFLGLTLKIADNLITVGQSLTPLIPLFTAIGAIKLSSGLRQFTGGFLGKANSGTQSASSTNNKLNTVQASAATANVNQSAAVSSNTVALNNLAAQINNLSGVLKASIAASTKTVIGPGGIARQVPRKFANGGIVPGVGNSDSVHARLMPGEFVIPKPAVNAIGADNLAMMARGGKTRRYAFGGKVGMASLYGPDSIPNSQQKLDLDKKFLQDKTALTPQFKNRYGIGASGDYDFTMVAGTINQKSAEGFDRTLEQAIEPVVAQYANNYLKLLSPGTQYVKQDLSKFGFEAMSGNIFEATIAAVGPPFDKDNNTQRFDFPSGLGSAAEPLFNKPELSNIITDAKRTYGNDSIKSVREKVYKLLKSENDEYWSRLSSKQKDTLVSSQVGRIQSRVPSLSGVDLAKQKRIEKQNKRLGFASGGQAIGTDTVDARLTPGEYVFDVESAKRIGYNNLEQMRKQRFAKGGRVHRFGSGGKAPVGTSTTSGFDSAKLAPLLFILPTIAEQFGVMDSSLSKTITQIITMGTIATATGKNLGNLTVSTEELQKSQANITKFESALKKSRKSRTETLSKASTDKKEAEFRANNIVRDIDKIKKQGPIISRKAYEAIEAKQGQLRNIINNPASTRANKGRAQRFLNNGKRFEVLEERQSALAKVKSEFLTANDAETKAQGRLESLSSKDTKLKNLKRSSRNIGLKRLAGQAAPGIGLGAAFLGNQLSDFANKNISAGRGTKDDVVSAGIGGGLSGAGSGAAAGFAVGGPLGAAVGALAGGIIGYTNSISEAEKQIENIKINKELDKFNYSLSRISKNPRLTNIDANNIRSQSNKLSASLSGASVDDRKEILNRAQGSLPDLENLSNKIASTSTSLEDFKTANGGAGEALLRLMSTVAGIPIEELYTQTEKTIKATQNAAALQNKINAALTQVYNDTRFVNNLVKAFNDASLAVNKTSSQFNLIANDFQTLSFDSNFDEVIAQGLKANPIDLTAALTQLIGGGGDGLAGRLGDSATAAQKLPDILRAAAASGPLSDTDPETQRTGLADAVEAGIADFPAELRSAISSKLDEFLSDDSGDGKFLTKVQENADKYAEQLTESAQVLIEGLSNAAKTAKDSANKLLSLITERNAIEAKVTEMSVSLGQNILKTSFKAGKIGTNKFNEENTSKEARSLFAASQGRRLASIQGIGGGTPQDLVKAIKSRQDTIQSNNKELQSLDPTSDRYKQLGGEIGNTQRELTNLNAALEEQANSTVVLSALQNELATAENKRKNQLALSTKLAFGGREGRKEFAQSAQNARTIANNPNAIGSAEQEGSALGFLEQVIEAGAGDKKLTALNGRSANEVKQQRLTAVVGPELAEALTNGSKEEKALQEAIIQTELAMAAAQQSQLSLQVTKLEKLDGSVRNLDGTLVDVGNNLGGVIGNGFSQMQTTFLKGLTDAEAQKADIDAKAEEKSLKTTQEKLTKSNAAQASLEKYTVSDSSGNATKLTSDQADFISQNAEVLAKGAEAKDKQQALISKQKRGDFSVDGLFEGSTGLFGDSGSINDDPAGRDQIRKKMEAAIDERFKGILDPKELQDFKAVAIEQALATSDDGRAEFGVDQLSASGLNNSLNSSIQAKLSEKQQAFQTDIEASQAVDGGEFAGQFGASGIRQIAQLNKDKLSESERVKLQTQAQEQEMKAAEARSKANDLKDKSSKLTTKQEELEKQKFIPLSQKPSVGVPKGIARPGLAQVAAGIQNVGNNPFGITAGVPGQFYGQGANLAASLNTVASNITPTNTPINRFPNITVPNANPASVPTQPISAPPKSGVYEELNKARAGVGLAPVAPPTTEPIAEKTSVAPQLTGRALAYQKMREAKAARGFPSIPTRNGPGLTLEESKKRILDNQKALPGRIADGNKAYQQKQYDTEIQARIQGYKNQEGSAGEKFINRSDMQINPMTSLAGKVGESLSETFKNGANVMTAGLTGAFDGIASKIPTDIGLVGKFEPLLVHITGSEMFKDLEDTLSAGIMAKIIDQLSKVMPVGFKGAMGPTQGQPNKKGTK